MAGYSRHRSVYRLQGYAAMRSELALDMGRLWQRNLQFFSRCSFSAIMPHSKALSCHQTALRGKLLIVHALRRCGQYGHVHLCFIAHCMQCFYYGRQPLS
eukprot:19633-Heterococcus_DN1.PRE.3